MFLFVYDWSTFFNYFKKIEGRASRENKEMKLKICACQWWLFGVVGNTWEHMGCSHAIIEERGNEKHSKI